MKETKSIIRRLTLLYYVFLVLIIAAVGVNMARFGDHTRIATFMAPQQMLDSTRTYDAMSFTKINFSHSVTHVATLDSSTRVTVIPSRADVLIESFDKPLLTPSESAVSMAANIVFSIVVTLFIVMFVVLIYNLGRSIVRQNIFNRRSVCVLKWFAWMMILFFVASEVYAWLDYTMVRDALMRAGYSTEGAFVWNFSMLITALMIYIFAEFMNLGCYLQQENDLTI